MKKGFTLAEVLITLGIIGVVAAMTLPSLVNKYKEKELCVKTRKMYSTLSNAVILAQKDFGVVGDNTFLFDVTKSSADVAKTFAKYFNGAKVCENSSQKGCSKYYYNQKYATRYSGSSGTTQNLKHTFPKIILNDGSVIAVQQMTSCDRVTNDCKQDSTGSCILDEDGNTTPVTSHSYVCAYLYIDVNGPKNPNQFGADSFQFPVASTKVMKSTWGPWGAASLENILSGKDKLEYTNYTVGEKR